MVVGFGSLEQVDGVGGQFPEHEFVDRAGADWELYSCFQYGIYIDCLEIICLMA